MTSKVIVRALATLAFCACLPSAYAQEADCGTDGIDGELLAVYDAVLHASDDDRKLLLDHAQRAWLAYREATCEVFSERPGRRWLAAEAFEDCLAFMARERTLELRILGRLSDQP
jgi:uncharacterized protein YecT (DUF1311 family)